MVTTWHSRDKLAQSLLRGTTVTTYHDGYHVTRRLPRVTTVTTWYNCYHVVQRLPIVTTVAKWHNSYHIWQPLPRVILTLHVLPSYPAYQPYSLTWGKVLPGAGCYKISALAYLHDMLFHHDGCAEIKINLYQSILEINLRLEVRNRLVYYYFYNNKHSLKQMSAKTAKPKFGNDVFCPNCYFLLNQSASCMTYYSLRPALTLQHIFRIINIRKCLDNMF